MSFDVRNPPVVAPIKPFPEWEPFVALLSGATLYEITSKANNNEFRAFFAHVIGQENFQNQKFLDLVNGVHALADYIMVSNIQNNRQIDPETAVRRAAEDMCGMAASVNALNNRSAFQQVPSQHLVADAEQKAAKMQQLDRALQEHVNRRIQQITGQQQQNWGQSNAWGNNTAPAQATGWSNFQPSNQAGWSNAPQTGWGRLTGTQPSNTSSTGFGGGLSGTTTPRTEVKENYFGGSTRVDEVRMDRDAPAQVSRSSWPTAESVMPSQGPRTGPVAPIREWPGQRSVTSQTAREEAVAAVQKLEPSYSVSPEAMEIANVQPGNWDSITVDDAEIRPAFKSGWQMTVTQQHPYRLAYDPNLHLLLHVRLDDGTVSESLTEWIEDMEYLQHELDPKLRRMAKEDQQRHSDKIWAEAAGARQLKNWPIATPDPELILDAEVRKELLDTDEITEHDGLLQCATHAEAFSLVETDLGYDQATSFTEKVFEFYYDVIERVVAPAGARELVRKIAGQKSLRAVRREMVTERETLSKRVVEAMNNRLTTAVNLMLQVDLGLTQWSITSFIDDLEELLKALEEKYGVWMTEAVGKGSELLIKSALLQLTDEDYATAEVADGVIVFVQRSSTTRVPATAEELGHIFEIGGRVQVEYYPKTHEALVNIISRTNFEQVGEKVDYPFVTRLIRTSDDKLFSIRLGLLGESDCVLIAPFA